MYIGRLVQSTGNVFTATAAYYQGEGSVRQNGLLPDTQRYVNGVMARRARYGRTEAEYDRRVPGALKAV